MSGTLSRDTLKEDIYGAFESMISSDLPADSRSDAEETMKKLANNLAIAIDSFVKAGTVSTTVSAITADGITVSGKGSGNIS